MRISEEELEAMEPVHTLCTDRELVVTLANGQKVVTPLWWYPRLLHATPQQRANCELSPFGVHWPDVDEDLSIEGMLVGSKAPRRQGAGAGLTCCGALNPPTHSPAYVVHD